MKKIATAALLAACALAPIAAQAGPFDSAYGNTVTRTNPDGSKTAIYVNADGTWKQVTGGQTVSGTYTWKNPSTACFTATNPAPTPEQAKMMGDGCQDFSGATHGVGDTWTEKTPDGKSVTMAITAGR
ncbi:MAG TPA: hypothetical protein VHL34_08560 [Rhizomicrobium sp.]|jgi:hypothetical protein|nr:hypothetical protein [Rhizomicrobium sp.]